MGILMVGFIQIHRHEPELAHALYLEEEGASACLNSSRLRFPSLLSLFVW